MEIEVLGISIGLGNIIAFIISYAKWHSILWGLFHGWLGWLYCIYYVLKYVI